jgi:hypothetical protein
MTRPTQGRKAASTSTSALPLFLRLVRGRRVMQCPWRAGGSEPEGRALFGRDRLRFGSCRTPFPATEAPGGRADGGPPEDQADGGPPQHLPNPDRFASSRTSRGTIRTLVTTIATRSDFVRFLGPRHGREEVFWISGPEIDFRTIMSKGATELLDRKPSVNTRRSAPDQTRTTPIHERQL